MLNTVAFTLMPVGFLAMGIGALVGPGTNSGAIEATGRAFQTFGAVTFLSGLGLSLLHVALA